MSATSIISRYNHMNGNAVSAQTLRAFYFQVQKHLDNDSHGPNTTHLVGIQKRIALALKKLAAAGCDSVERINLTPIEINGGYQHPKKTGTTARNPISKKARKKIKWELPSLSSVDVYGLEKGAPQGETGELTGLGFTKDGQKKIYDMITGMILKIMKDENKLPWRKPWAIDSIAATNFISRKPYKGANMFLLNLIAPMFFGKTGPYWMTYNQAKQAGGNVKKGSSGFPVIFYNIYYSVSKPTRKTITEEQYKAMSIAERTAAGALELFTINYYTVFAQEDIEGIEFPVHGKRRGDASPIESAQAIIDGMPQRPEIIHHKTGRAFYSPSDDHIKLPELEYFNSDQEYYSTLFHELVHSTGHESRLNRFTVNKDEAEGKDDYAYEELIAEMGASYLNAESGTLYFTMKNSASYLKGWQTKLENLMKDDNKFFLRASAKAAQACDFILNRNETVVETPKPKRDKKKSSRPPVKREGRSKATAELSPVLSGFTSADQLPEVAADTFTLPGEIGKLLGKLQAYKLGITVSGETSSSKSELIKQIANAFVAAGYSTAYIDWEHGGMNSKDTQEGIKRNVDAENRKKLFVGEVPRTLEAVKELTKHFKVIVLDSGTKLKHNTNEWIDQLREEHPDTIWIIAMQQNEKGGTRGGSAAEFDSTVVMKTYRADQTDPLQNYTIVEKNRGNATGLQYNIAQKKIIEATT